MQRTTSKTSFVADLKSTRDNQNLFLYYREIGRTRTLSSEEEASLAKRIRQNDRDALNILIRANLRFVVSVCRHYQHQGLPLCDLINEGNLGLIRAAKRFDESRQFKFISYAVWWVRQSILQALSEQSRTIKLPASRIGHLSRINRCMTMMEQKLQRQPTPEEMAKVLELEVSMIESSVEMGQATSSLDAPRSNEEESGLLDVLPGNQENNPDLFLEMRERNEGIVQALESLLPREASVLKLYFGIDPEVPHSLEEIGERLNLTRERVRQIKERALSKLKHTSRSKSLFSHVSLV